MSNFRKPAAHQIGYKAGQDLSTHLYKCVKVVNDEVVLADTNGEVIYGFLGNIPEQNQFCEVLTAGGGAQGVAGVAITRDTYLMTNAVGKLIPATTGLSVVAIARRDAVLDDIFEIEPAYFVLP